MADDVFGIRSFLMANETNVTTNATHITPLNYAYLTLTCLMSSLSALGSLLIIGTYFAYSQLQNTSRRMLLHLSVADLLLTVGNFVGVPEAVEMTSTGPQATTICVISATIATISSISSFALTSFIAFYLYFCIVLSRSRQLGTGIMVTIYTMCWLFPVVVAVLANIFHVYGYDPLLHHMSSCWISSSVQNHLMWQFVTDKGWEIVAYFVTGTFYTLIRCHVRKKFKNGVGSSNIRVMYKTNLKMTLIPIVFIFVRIWGTLRFLIGVVDHSYANSPGIVIMQGLGDSSQGFANCILFCFCSPKVSQLLLSSIKKWTSCCQRKHPRMATVRSRRENGRSSPSGLASQTTGNPEAEERAPLLKSKRIPPSLTIQSTEVPVS